MTCARRALLGPLPFRPPPRAPGLLAAMAFGLLAAAGCAGRPQPPPVATTTPAAAPGPERVAAPHDDEAFRKTAPPLGPDSPFVAPAIQEARLKNGVRVRVVSRHEAPVVSMDFAFDRGAAQDRPGIGGFVAAMLLRGTKARSASELSDALQRLGAEAQTGMDYDAAELFVKCVAAKFPDALTLAAELVQRPAFAKDEIERERAERLTAIAQQRERPKVLLETAVAEALYPPGHPYASPLLGSADAVTRLTASDLARFHATAFGPDRLTIGVVGDVTFDDAVAQVERAFGAWRQEAPKPELPPFAGAPRSDGARVVLVDRPGATQSQVAVALVGPPRVNADYDALLVMNGILGGMFSSRLNLNLREEHGYTYGVRSSFDFRRGPGPFTAGGAIVREKTGPAVTEMLREIERMRAEAVTDAELADAKANLVRGLPGRFETSGGTAQAVAWLSVYGLPLDEYATRAARIERVTREDVTRVAATYLPAGAIRVIVVGDARVVEGQLAEIGLGPVTVRGAGETKAKASGGVVPGHR